MFNHAPSLGRLTLGCLCLAGLLGLFFAVRCTRENPLSKKSPAVSASQMAHLTLLNDSNCEWQIAMTPAAGGEPRSWKLPLAKSLKVELAGGDYQVEQTMLTDDAGPNEPRRFSLRLTAGESYRWRLVTLLSGAAEDDRLPAQTQERHE
jgi:hypothetical protein